MEEQSFFAEGFLALTGKEPFAWQQRLFGEHFVLGGDKLPAALDIPTGLGKTSVIAIWLLALAWQARTGAVRLPRRLVYVVDRRTVVDQATDIARELHKRLHDGRGGGPIKRVREALDSLCVDPGDKGSPLTISTLRGEFADNREWQSDPARAAIVVGTVDLVGSRLLFSGYGVSRKMQPFHAGLLGQDALLIHDEAHLSPAFGRLAKGIAEFQRKDREPRPLKVIELSATARGAYEADRPFILTDEDYANETVARRLAARKALHLQDLAEGVKLEDELARHALQMGASPARVLIYVRSPDVARKLASQLAKDAGEDHVAVLTGTIRGFERDKLVESKLFDGFRARSGREKPPESHYLVATSAGEVGIDLDADHVVCDLTELDSMIQRLGRVNRLGEGAASIDVIVAPPPKDDADATDRDRRIKATKAALATLPAVADGGGHDSSPAALRDLVTKTLTEAEREACFSRTPDLVELTDVLLDGWAMTSVQDLPGRPKVERWLHGDEPPEPPSLYVAWREEVSEISYTEPAELQALFETHEILARERVGGRLGQVRGELDAIARRVEGAQAVLIPAAGDPRLVSLADLGDEDELHEATIVLPPGEGGLDRNGMLNGREAGHVDDVADERLEADAAGRPERMRVLLRRDPETEAWSARPLAQTDRWDLGRLVAEAVGLRAAARAAREARPLMAETGRIVLARDNLGAETKVLVLLNERGSLETAQESSAAAARSQLLDLHNRWAGEEADRIVLAAALEPSCAEAVVGAARSHDLGKDRDPWQADIGNPRPRKAGVQWLPLAKSGRRGFVSHLAGSYRHEFGSLRQAMANAAIGALAENDLILHLIAAHHGWARPHFAPEHWDIDPDVTDEENAEIAIEVRRRYTRLQRRFGRWGLAWLESMVRAADYAASRRLEGALPNEEPARPTGADA